MVTSNTAPTETHPSGQPDIGPILAPIIVGVDGSSASEAALGWALASSAMTGQPVRAVMVVAPPMLAASGLDGMVVIPPDAFDASVILERTIERAVADPELRQRIERRVLMGNAADRLLEEAAAATALVVGRSRSTLGQLFFGTARRLVADAPCPVVVVPPRSERRTGSGTGDAQAGRQDQPLAAAGVNGP